MTSARLQSLEARLNALHETHKTTLQLINRLANLKFQPGSIPLNGDDTNPRTELTSEIHESLKNEDEDLDLLKQEVTDLAYSDHVTASRRDTESGKAQVRLEIQLARLEEDFKQARTRFRAAQVQSKRNAQLARAQERDLLFSSKSEGLSEEAPHRRRDHRPKGGQDETVAASGDVTAALRRTQQLLQTEVQRSHFAQEIFNQSSEAIKQLSQSYNDLDSLLTSSKTLLTTLVKSNKSDTWYLETSVYLLVATIAWLVFRRFLYGPLWWFAWLPLKYTYRTLFLVYGIIGIGGKAKTTGLTVSSSITPSSSSWIVPSASMSSVSEQTSEGKPKPTQETPLSDEVAEMAEKTNPVKKEQTVRGDGTALKHSDAPRNSKKRMWEEKPPVAQEEKKEKDEL